MLIHAPTRDFRDWVSDSRRWAGFQPRAGDIVVATPPKCGTTWTQRIVGMLLRQSAAPYPVMETQPWIDQRIRPIADVLAMLAAQPGRRAVKTHSPLDALPYFDEMLYIHVTRDPRDACMSYHNHVTAYTPLARTLMDQAGMADATIGRCLPVTPDDPGDFFRAFMGVPGCAPSPDFSIAEYCDIERSYWAARHRPNMLMVHYNDLKADLDGEMRRIANFCGIETPDALWGELVAAADFAAMKRDAAALLPAAGVVFAGGGERFLHKGTNQRWRDVARAADLACYQSEAARGMSPALKAWAESGRLVAGDPVALAD